jgi:hypothetical protein
MRTFKQKGYAMSLLFYLISMFVPLLGRYRGIRWKGLLAFSGLLLGFMSTLGIPSLLSALYLRCRVSRGEVWSKYVQALFSVLIPALCMFLFIIHPVAGKAWAYSLYWLIPIFLGVVGLFKKTTLFFEHLAATFIAHAAGSLVWCYLIPVSASKWVALIPIVALERFLFAGTQLLILVGISLVSALCSRVFHNMGEVDATSCNDYGWQSSLGSRK